jgi:hypothetical protein
VDTVQHAVADRHLYTDAAVYTDTDLYADDHQHAGANWDVYLDADQDTRSADEYADQDAHADRVVHANPDAAADRADADAAKHADGLPVYRAAVVDHSTRIFAEPGGCQWQGVGGQVTTARGEPVRGIQVRIVDDTGREWRVRSGTNQTYGVAGWEIKLSSETNNGRYTVSLWANDEQVSPSVVIVFPNACQQNLATVNFIQTRPY